ncbi:MAG: hypothetical protein AAF628_11160 [Planctomycetota bacterium]
MTGPAPIHAPDAAPWVRHRAIFAFGFRAAGRGMLLPLLAGQGIAALVIRSLPPLAENAAGTASGIWLHLPAAAAAIGALSATIAAWPLLGRGEPSAALVARLQPGPAGGVLPLGAGALSALTLGLLAAGLGWMASLRWANERLPATAAYAPLVAEGDAILDQRHPELFLSASTRRPARSLVLTPMAIMAGAAGGLAPRRLWVEADGEPLHREALQVASSHARVEVPFATQRIQNLTLRTDAAPGIAVLFVPGTAELVLEGPRSTVANAMLAAVSHVIPAATALAVAALVRARVAAGLLRVAAMLLVLVGAASQLAPSGAAVAAFAAGRWIPAEQNVLTWASCWLCAAAAATLAAMVLATRHRS